MEMKKILPCNWLWIFIGGLTMSAFPGATKSTNNLENDNITITQLVKLCCSDDEVFDIITKKCVPFSNANLFNKSKMDALNEMIDIKGKIVVPYLGAIDQEIWGQENYKIAYKYQADPLTKVQVGDKKLVVQRIYPEYFRYTNWLFQIYLNCDNKLILSAFPQQ